MNTNDIVKALAEKGFSISEQEVQSKISANKLSAPTGQIQNPFVAPVPAQTSAAHQLHNAPGISYRVFDMIIEISLHVPYRLANIAEIVKEAATVGISQKQVEEAVNALDAEGKCIEPVDEELLFVF